MPHYCGRETLQCVHSSLGHPAGLYVCNVCKATWEISWRENVLTRLTRNNVDRLEKVKSAQQASRPVDVAAIGENDAQVGAVAECLNCKKRVAFIVIQGTGQRLRCPHCWSVQKQS